MVDYDVVVIGAGFSGVFAAREAAAKGYKVLLVETGDEIVPNISSSFNECYKLHTGLHYAGDLKTATQCLESSVQFTKAYKDFILGSDGSTLPWRRGRYYILSNSLISAEDTRKVASVLREKYRMLCKKDESNEVFGNPEEFIIELSSEQHPEIATSIPFEKPIKVDRTDLETGKTTTELTVEIRNATVTLALETPESQIDLPKFKQYLEAQLSSNPNITFLPCTTAQHIAPLIHEIGYNITLKQPTGTITHIPVAAVINCTWHKIEAFEMQVVRTKISVLVRLPESLQNLNTCIFATGPFCSITNLGDGTAILTSEQTTNAGFYRTGDHDYHPSFQEEALAVGKLIKKNSSTDISQSRHAHL